jgi:nucleoside-diphosphate kinase
VSLAMNVIHGSDSAASAAREVGIFFSEDELITWESSPAVWVIAED